MSKRKNTPRGAMNRWGKIVGKGAVVQQIGSDKKGIVVRLLPHSDFSRAYGRQALVEWYYGKSRKVVHHSEVGIDDLKVVGYAKRLPATHTVTASGFREEIVTPRKYLPKKNKKRPAQAGGAW
jgi:hypothetical protein